MCEDEMIFRAANKFKFLFFETAFFTQENINKSRATWLLIGRWKNSEENKKR
jgi:hypothetical protein